MPGRRSAMGPSLMGDDEMGGAEQPSGEAICISDRPRFLAQDDEDRLDGLLRIRGAHPQAACPDQSGVPAAELRPSPVIASVHQADSRSASEAGMFRSAMVCLHLTARCHR